MYFLFRLNASTHDTPSNNVPDLNPNRETNAETIFNLKNNVEQ